MSETGTSFDDFWAEVERAELAERGALPTVDICGVTVTVPHDNPLRVELGARAKADSTAMEDVQQLVGDLFGTDVLDHWITAGMTNRQFRTVLLWGLANGNGKEMSFAQAYEFVKDGELGKASRTTLNSRSDVTGGPSRPTSTASTGSGLATSAA